MPLARFFALPLCAVAPCFAQSTQGDDAKRVAQAQALEIIANFAGRLCAAPESKGADQTLELSGTAKADLTNVLKKVADLGIEGAVQFNLAEYQGVLQRDLPKLLEDASKCRLEVWRDLKDRLLPTSPSQPSPTMDGSQEEARLQREKRLARLNALNADLRSLSTRMEDLRESKQKLNDTLAFRRQNDAAQDNIYQRLTTLRDDALRAGNRAAARQLQSQTDGIRTSLRESRTWQREAEHQVDQLTQQLRDMEFDYRALEAQIAVISQ